MTKRKVKVELAGLSAEKGLRFSLDNQAGSIPCFAIQFENQILAFENRCPHLGTELDWAPGVFLDDELQHIVCSTHGAYFEPKTGRCVSGPCIGQALKALEISVEGTKLLINNPYEL